MIINPFWPTIPTTLSLNPLKEVVDNLRTHTVPDNYNLFIVDSSCGLNVHFQPCEILVAYFEIPICQPPIVTCSIGISGVITLEMLAPVFEFILLPDYTHYGRQTLEDFRPDPVPGDEEICRIKPNCCAEFDVGGVETSVLVQHYMPLTCELLRFMNVDGENQIIGFAMASTALFVVGYTRQLQATSHHSLDNRK